MINTNKKASAKIYKAPNKNTHSFNINNIFQCQTSDKNLTSKLPAPCIDFK